MEALAGLMVVAKQAPRPRARAFPRLLTYLPSCALAILLYTNILLLLNRTSIIAAKAPPIAEQAIIQTPSRDNMVATA